MRHKKAADFIAGANLHRELIISGINLHGVYAGAFMRDDIQKNISSLYFTGGLVFRRINIGISYDFNITKMITGVNNNGAFEVSLVYKEIFSVLKEYSIPCERF